MTTTAPQTDSVPRGPTFTRAGNAWPTHRGRARAARRRRAAANRLRFRQRRLESKP